MSVHPAQSPPKPAATQRALPRRRAIAERLLDGPGFNRLRFVIDTLMLVLAMLAAVAGAHAADVHIPSPAILAAFPPLALALLALRGMYRTKMRVLILDGIAPVVGAISIAAMSTIVLQVLFDPGTHPAGLIARAWVFAVVYVGGGRILLAMSQRRARARGALSKPTLIVGAGVVGSHVARRLEEVPEYGLKPIGFLDDDPLASVEEVDRNANVLGTTRHLAEVVQRTGAGHVILAFTNSADSGLVPLLRRCEELGLEISVVPRLFESINERVVLEHIGGMPLLGLHTVDPKGWQFAIKHVLETVFAVICLILMAPLLLAVAVAVKASSPGPVLYRQRRMGRDDRVFDLLKFRSMRIDPPPESAEQDGFRPAPGLAPGGVEGDDRRTPIGRFLRRTSIDELPQLVNVVRGEMSLVGPRPERPEYVSMFRDDIDRYVDRHRVRSGLTGWAQVHGYRGQTSLADRVEWDNYYIENWSLWLDFKIMVMTVAEVFRPTPGE